MYKYNYSNKPYAWFTFLCSFHLDFLIIPMLSSSAMLPVASKIAICFQLNDHRLQVGILQWWPSRSLQNLKEKSFPSKYKFMVVYLVRTICVKCLSPYQLPLHHRFHHHIHVPILEVVKVRWPDDEYLSSLNANYDTCSSLMFATLLEMVDPLNGHTSQAFQSSLSDLLRVEDMKWLHGRFLVLRESP